MVKNDKNLLYKTQTKLFILSVCWHNAPKCRDCNKDLPRDFQWITFHSCHHHMTHNALIFYACFPLKQHNVHEQTLLCRGWTSTSLLSHQLPLPETLNHQTPVLLCELAFCSRIALEQHPPLTLTFALSLSLWLHILSPPSRLPLFLFLAIVICHSHQLHFFYISLQYPILKSLHPYLKTSVLLIFSHLSFLVLAILSSP